MSIRCCRWPIIPRQSESRNPISLLVMVQASGLKEVLVQLRLVERNLIFMQRSGRDHHHQFEAANKTFRTFFFFFFLKSAGISMAHLSPYICSHNSSLFALTHTYVDGCMYLCMAEVDKQLLKNYSEPFAWYGPFTRQLAKCLGQAQYLLDWLLSEWDKRRVYGPAQFTWQLIC